MEVNLIFGLSELAEVLYYCMNEQGRKITGFIVDDEFYNQGFLLNNPVYKYSEVSSLFKQDEVVIFLAIGYTQMNQVRKSIFQKVKKDGYKVGSFVHQSAICSNVQMGEGNLLFEQTYIGPYTVIGNCNILYPKALIAHHNNIGDFNFFAISSSVAGNVIVKSGCFVGNNSTTKDGIKIGNKVLIGAGAYASKDLFDEQVLAADRSVILKNHSSKDFL